MDSQPGTRLVRTTGCTVDNFFPMSFGLPPRLVIDLHALGIPFNSLEETIAHQRRSQSLKSF